MRAKEARIALFGLLAALAGGHWMVERELRKTEAPAPAKDAETKEVGP